MTALVVSLLADVWPYLIAGGAILAAVFGFGRQKRNEGIALQKAKEAEAREEIRKKLVDAAVARPTVSVSDDPHNRDNQGRN